jgi:hypothetical protein
VQGQRVAIGLGKLVALVVLAVAIGVAVGIGLDELSSGDSGSGGETATPSAQELDVEIRSAQLVRATTASGRQRNRSRLTLRLQVANRGSTAALGSGSRDAVVLVAGSRTVRADRAALREEGAFPLERPLAEGVERTGELRFELAGDATDAVSAGRSTLRIPAGPGAEPITRRVTLETR